MIEQAGLSASIATAAADSGGRKVVGKPLLAVSAGGMAIVVGMLCRGSWMEALTAFLLTIAALEIMLHRALARFDAPLPPLADAPKGGRRQRTGRPTP
jgi:uncharacterized membrane protein YjjP (DUF1212 family)